MDPNGGISHWENNHRRRGANRSGSSSALRLSTSARWTQRASTEMSTWQNAMEKCGNAGKHTTNVESQ